MIFGVAGGVTAATLGLALWLGATYFDARRGSAHEERLRHMLAQAPLVTQVEAGLRDDGSPLVASFERTAELEVWARRWPGALGEQLRAKGQSHPKARIFQAHDTYYAIFFDPQGVMRDYLCLPHPPR